MTSALAASETWGSHWLQALSNDFDGLGSSDAFGRIGFRVGPRWIC